MARGDLIFSLETFRSMNKILQLWVILAIFGGKAQGNSWWAEASNPQIGNTGVLFILKAGAKSDEAGRIWLFSVLKPTSQNLKRPSPYCCLEKRFSQLANR